MPGRVPGNTKHLRRLIEYNSQKAFLSLESKLVGGSADYFCNCFKYKLNKTKQAYNDPTQKKSTRIADLTVNSLGGKISFGNYNTPAKLTYLGGIEGQPGGIPRPPRNKF